MAETRHTLDGRKGDVLADLAAYLNELEGVESMLELLIKAQRAIHEEPRSQTPEARSKGMAYAGQTKTEIRRDA